MKKEDGYAEHIINACKNELQAHNQPITPESLNAMITQTEKEMNGGTKVYAKHTEQAYWKLYRKQEIIKATKTKI